MGGSCKRPHGFYLNLRRGHGSRIPCYKSTSITCQTILLLSRPRRQHTKLGNTMPNDMRIAELDGNGVRLSGAYSASRAKRSMSSFGMVAVCKSLGEDGQSRKSHVVRPKAKLWDPSVRDSRSRSRHDKIAMRCSAVTRDVCLVIGT